MSETDYRRIHKVYKIENNGLLRTIIGQKEINCDCQWSNCDCFEGDGFHPSKAKLNVPADIHVSKKTNNLIIADQGNQILYIRN